MLGLLDADSVVMGRDLHYILMTSSYPFIILVHYPLQTILNCLNSFLNLLILSNFRKISPLKLTGLDYLDFNTNKFRHLSFYNRVYTIDDSSIMSSNTHCDLGIILSTDLSLS